MALYESLRLGYPIGSLLFLSSKEVGEKLSPRAFHGVGSKAANSKDFESLVLDGQQRITAGLSIKYGLEDVAGSEFYIDLKFVSDLIKKNEINIDDDDEIQRFTDSLDLEDYPYLVAKKSCKVRQNHFFEKDAKLIWTAFFSSEKSDLLDELIDKATDFEKKIYRRVIRKHLAPNFNIQVPVITLDNSFDMKGVARVFTTINTTGKLLTSFELVVAMLYPFGIQLEDDVSKFKQQYQYYCNMDKNGIILLQVIALLSGNSPKKSDLPDTIDAVSYKKYAEEAAILLNESGKFLTEHLGVGLDQTGRFVPYDAIFAPLAVVYKKYKQVISGKGSTEEANQRRKLQKWFIGSALVQEYQEGVHNKQGNHAIQMIEWLGDDQLEPKWLKDAYVTPKTKLATPSGAIGKLFICLLNSMSPKDPINNQNIGFGAGKAQSEVHHIYPTKWADKGLKDFRKGKDSVNLALNCMILSSDTNRDWLNFSPFDQVQKSAEAQPKGSNIAFNRYSQQLVNDEAFKILNSPAPRVKDFEDFIDARFAALVKYLRDFNVKDLSGGETDDVDPDEPSISEHD